MEGEGYAIGASDLCAAGVGAPHIRQRLWFYARDSREGLEHAARNGWDERWAEPGGWGLASRRGAGGLADRDDTGLEGRWQPERGRADKCTVGANSLAGGLADADDPKRRSDAAQGNVGIRSNPGRSQGAGDAEGRGGYGDARATDDLWRDADWLYCRDGKWRPVEPGTFPLANGSAARVGRLRGYGNAIVAKVATTFIEAVM
jgi:DNA (cytosine-5)-methyltransferase 1